MALVGGVMRPVVRAFMSRVEDPELMRRQFDLAAQLWFRAVPFTLSLPDAYPSEFPMDGLWVNSGHVHPRRVLLYFHGGGYIAGSPETHRNLVSRLSRISGLRAFLPAYRLAPEHPVPAGFQDAIAAHRHLISRGYRAQDIVLGGDSAGGGLALALLAHLCQIGQQPAACFAWSPFCDMTFSGASVQNNGKRDHFFPGHRVHDLANRILGATPPTDPRASPLYADFPNCPPVLLQVSDSEILQDDALRMARHLQDRGAQAEVQVFHNAPHVWHLFDGWFPEARDAIQKTGTFIRSHVQTSAEN